ncbi:MAG TPA: tetratricopeptide repeat protein [Gemmatimonadaceae bacterium]|jgi:lipoprotein NlpI|nr:tetratricopeptide repeat protein [Gemmatimonadaceae bacterium]
MQRNVLTGLVGLTLAIGWMAACDKRSRDASTFTTAGVAHLQQKEYDRAIRDFDRAIALQPGLVVAWRNRGLAHREKGDFERAIADYDQAALLSPADARVFNDRGLAYVGMDDYAHAIQDFDRAISLKPDHAAAMQNRGRTYFLLGNHAQAAADLQRGLLLDSTNASAVIWLHLARQRMRQDDASDFAAQSAVADTTRWPAPVLRYLQGRLSADSLRAVSDSTDADSRADQRCAAAFYLGEAALLREARDSAATLFEETRASCPRAWTEYKGAVAELRKLGRRE